MYYTQVGREKQAEWGMRNAEWGMRNGECGMRNSDECLSALCYSALTFTLCCLRGHVYIEQSFLNYSPFRIPHSAFPIPHSALTRVRPHPSYPTRPRYRALDCGRHRVPFPLAGTRPRHASHLGGDHCLCAQPGACVVGAAYACWAASLGGADVRGARIAHCRIPVDHHACRDRSGRELCRGDAGAVA